MTPDPIEELRKCLSEPRFTTSKAITDALAAYDAKCAEVESKDAIIKTLRAQLEDPPIDVQELVIKKCDLVSRQALDTANAQKDVLREAFGEGTEWPVWDILDQFVLASDHYSKCHDCDHHGWEITEWAAKIAKQQSVAIKQALSTTTPSPLSERLREAEVVALELRRRNERNQV